MNEMTAARVKVKLLKEIANQNSQLRDAQLNKLIEYLWLEIESDAHFSMDGLKVEKKINLSDLYINQIYACLARFNVRI